MKTAILGLFAASALGCAAVADGRLETAVDNAVGPIPMIDGEVGIKGTIDTPEGICNGTAEVLLRPYGFEITCANYSLRQIHDNGEEELYSCIESLLIFPDLQSVGDPYEDSYESWHSYGCNGSANEHFRSITTPEAREEARRMGWNPAHNIEDLPLENERYQSLREQMNVQEADTLWREWMHTAFNMEVIQ